MHDLARDELESFWYSRCNAAHYAVNNCYAKCHIGIKCHIGTLAHCLWHCLCLWLWIIGLKKTDSHWNSLYTLHIQLLILAIFTVEKVVGAYGSRLGKAFVFSIPSFWANVSLGKFKRTSFLVAHLIIVATPNRHTTFRQQDAMQIQRYCRKEKLCNLPGSYLCTLFSAAMRVAMRHAHVPFSAHKKPGCSLWPYKHLCQS